MVERCIISYYYRNEHINKINNDNNINNEQKQDMLKILNKQKNDIIKNIKLFDKNIDTNYIKSNYIILYNNIIKGWKNIFESIQYNMKKAYLDLIRSELSQNKINMLFNLLMEISKRIIKIK